MKFLKYKDDNEIDNEFFRNALKNRSWSTAEDSLNNFITGYECYVCEQVLVLLKNEMIFLCASVLSRFFSLIAVLVEEMHCTGNFEACLNTSGSMKQRSFSRDRTVE